MWREKQSLLPLAEMSYQAVGASGGHNTENNGEWQQE